MISTARYAFLILFQCKDMFRSRNLASLHEIGGGDLLLDTCHELSYLKRYVTYHTDARAGKAVPLPTSASDAAVVRSRYMYLDLAIV